MNNPSIPSPLPTAWKYLKCSLKYRGKETAFCSPGVLFSFADCQHILVKGQRQAFSQRACAGNVGSAHRYGNCQSSDGSSEQQQHLKKKTRRQAQTLHTTHKVLLRVPLTSLVYTPISIADVAPGAPPQAALSDHTCPEQCGTPSTEWQGIFCCGFSNNSLCCSHLTPNVGERSAHQRCLDHPSRSLGSSPLHNGSDKFISLPESQNTK